MTIRCLFDSLTEDTWRREHPFSEDMMKASKVLTHPYAKNHEREEALSAWLQRHQSCRFGRLAAAQGGIRYCILTGKDLRQSDANIEGKIRRELTIWKQMAAACGERSPHSFLLVLAAPEIELAAPNVTLENLARRFAAIVAPDSKEDIVENDIRTQHLYLENPVDGTYYAFDVILDFFAASGDGRWWHDHRIPGGIGFTLNSVGHMARNQEWFERKGSRTEWAVKTAMNTIDASFETNDGKATWLRSLNNGAPRKAARCPFAEPEKVPAALAGKDWTVYGGKYETDHSVRREFFDGSNEVAARRHESFLLDFSYLHRSGRDADAALISGLRVDASVVFGQIGHRDDWRLTHRGATWHDAFGANRTAKASNEIEAALAQCKEWKLDVSEIDGLLTS